MSKNLPEGSLVVVADGTQAKFFRLHRNAGTLSLDVDGTLEPIRLDDDGPSGVRPPESTPEETDEATFAKQLGHYLNKRAEQDQFQSLVLIVDPQTLGQLRPVLGHSASSRVQAELAKTLTTSPTSEIIRSLESSA